MSFLNEDEKEQFEISYPNVEDFSNEEKLAMEKEVLGIYASGHPLDEYEELLNKNVTATTADFVIDDETGKAKAHDQVPYIIGGIISDKTVKLTRNNQNMAFITLEDLRGTVEVVVFPRDYSIYQNDLKEDAKVFIQGRAQVSEEEAKLICSQVIPFDQVPKEIWIQFMDKDEYFAQSSRLTGLLQEHKGSSPVVVFCRKERAIKRLPAELSIKADEAFLEQLYKIYKTENIKVVDKTIDKFKKMY